MHGTFNHRPKQTLYKYHISYTRPHTSAKIEITGKGFKFMNSAIDAMAKELKLIDIDVDIKTQITHYKE